MKPDEKVVDILLKNKELYLSQIVGETGMGITHFENGETVSSKNLPKLENVFFTLDFLEKNKLIKISSETGFSVKKDGAQVSCFDLIVESSEDEFFFRELWKKFNGRIQIEMSLWEFKKNGYKTDQQKRDFQNVWMPIVAAILAAFFTAFFTSFLDCFSCLS